MEIKLDHVNLTVGNLNESVDWYGKVFGFELVEHGIGRVGQRWAIVAKNDSMICMSEYVERKSAAQDYDEDHHKFYHFGIRVSDVEAWEEKVKSLKLRLYYGGVNDYPGSKSWYIHDPSGHEIEVSYANGQPLKFPKND